jgi:hypothetical protein
MYDLRRHRKSRKRVLLNGWFGHGLKSFPPSRSIDPIFFGFHLEDPYKISNKTRRLLAKYTIGCRDTYTSASLAQQGLSSKLTYCPTLLFNRQALEEKLLADPTILKNREHILDSIRQDSSIFHLGRRSLRILVVDAQNDLPTRPNTQSQLRKVLEHLKHKWPIHEITLRAQNYTKKDLISENLECGESLALLRLAEIASSHVVVTNRLHVALPSVAMGVPTFFLFGSVGTDTRIVDYLPLFINDTIDCPLYESMDYEAHFSSVQKRLPFLKEYIFQQLQESIKSDAVRFAESS